jgi:cellulose synthase operon protein B
MIALRGRYAHPVIQVMESDPGPSPTGTIKVALGVASELRGLVAGVPDAATLQALAALMQDQNGGSTLLVTGPSWTDLDTAINIVGGPTVANGGVERTTVDTASWHWPEVPMAKGQRSFRFSDLGIATQEFSGRRLKAQFAINLPADFYATEYGEMILNLDAAYTSAIKPGSRVDIIVNGRISATRMFTSQGNVVRQHPIRVAMKNLRPGINYFAVETNLLTDADERCAPGETLSEAKRFVLFDTSRLDIPEFGRIGREPDLAVLSSGLFPYGDMPAAVVMARPDQAHYSATGTLLARMARSAGAPVRSYFATAATAEDRSVLFVGAVDQLPPRILSRVNVTENLRVTWPSTPGKTGQQVASADFSLPAGQLALDRPDMSSTDDVRRRWAETFQRRGIIQQTVGSVKDWLEQTFSLSLASLSLRENADPPYEPPQRSTLMVAQSHVAGAGTWTLVTARTEEALAEEMARLSDPILWSQVSGRAVALDPREQKLEVQPINNFSFVQTQPLSLSNLRLVAANWMSANILQYALLMVAFCTLLGASTYLLLNRLGRSS